MKGDGLPNRLRVVSKEEKGQPVADILFTNWNLAASTTDEMFEPQIPKDYEGIAIIQRAASLPKPDPNAPQPDASSKPAK